MRIGGLQKTTLLDFPGLVSAVVFTQGCNFRCPYCHNPELVACGNEGGACGDEAGAGLDAAAFLAARRHVLQGVVISGGEPALQVELESFCVMLKSLGYAIKLDTNGSRPEVLRRLLSRDLLDYVAVDVKAAPGRYPQEIAPGDAGAGVAESIVLLGAGSVPHEFRIPCAAPFVDAAVFEEILDATDGNAPIFLQTVQLKQVFNSDFFQEKGRPLTRKEMGKLRRAAAGRGRYCRIR